jgi:hypothetical protein
MSNLDANIDDATIDEVLYEISKLSTNPRLQPGSADLPIDLNTKISDFISILFGEDGLKNSGNDKMEWLKLQQPVDKSIIDLDRLNVFLSDHRNAIQTVIAAAPPPVVSPTPTPLVSTAAPAAPAAPAAADLAVISAPPPAPVPLKTSDAATTVPLPASSAAASVVSTAAPAVVAAPILSVRIAAKTELKEHLLNIGFNSKEVDDYISTNVSTDLTNAINEILNKTDTQKQESNIEIMSDIFGRNNLDLIKETLKEAKGDIVVAGDLLARKLVPKLEMKPETKPILKQASIFDGKFFQYKETGLGCGRFALNNLLGGRYFTAVRQNDFPITLPYDLASIKGLIEKLNPNTAPDPSHMLDLQRLCKYLKMNNSETMDDCLSYELYDQSVITNALGLLGYTVKIAGGKGTSPIKATIDMLDSNTGMIVNLSAAHYISIRKHDNIYYLMDSENKQANKGSTEFISKLLNYDRNITFVVGPYDINTSKKTIILMKIQEYFTTEGDNFDFDEHGEIRAVLIKFITDLKNPNIINGLYSKEITNIPYDDLPGNMNEYTDNFVRLLTTPKK